MKDVLPSVPHYDDIPMQPCVFCSAPYTFCRLVRYLRRRDCGPSDDIYLRLCGIGLGTPFRL
jgi:hypothetical protein